MTGLDEHYNTQAGTDCAVICKYTLLIQTLCIVHAVIIIIFTSNNLSVNLKLCGLRKKD